MAVKRPATQSSGPPAKRPRVGGVAAESVARMLGIVGVAEIPSTTVSFGRAGFAAHMDKVSLHTVAQDLLQAAQQRPRSYVAAPSSASVVDGGEQQQPGVSTSSGIKSEGDARGTSSAHVLNSASLLPESTGAGAAGISAYAAREQAVVDCFVAIVQQAAASCTQSQSKPQRQQQQQQQLVRRDQTGAAAAYSAPGETVGSVVHNSVESAAVAPIDSGDSKAAALGM